MILQKQNALTLLTKTATALCLTNSYHINVAIPEFIENKQLGVIIYFIILGKQSTLQFNLSKIFYKTICKISSASGTYKS